VRNLAFFTALDAYEASWSWRPTARSFAGAFSAPLARAAGDRGEPVARLRRGLRSGGRTFPDRPLRAAPRPVAPAGHVVPGTRSPWGPRRGAAAVPAGRAVAVQETGDAIELKGPRSRFASRRGPCDRTWTVKARKPDRRPLEPNFGGADRQRPRNKWPRGARLARCGREAPVRAARSPIGRRSRHRAGRDEIPVGESTASYVYTVHGDGRSRLRPPSRRGGEGAGRAADGLKTELPGVRPRAVVRPRTAGETMDRKTGAAVGFMRCACRDDLRLCRAAGERTPHRRP
jgi:hypothetical protein